MLSPSGRGACRFIGGWRVLIRAIQGGQKLLILVSLYKRFKRQPDGKPSPYIR
jgi:hypothetical protein